jgi:hypothetical protein
MDYVGSAAIETDIGFSTAKRRLRLLSQTKVYTMFGKDEITNWEQYAQTLIPVDRDWIPRPRQVAAFLDGLLAIGSAPLRPTIRVGRTSVDSRKVANDFGGEVSSVPRRDWVRPKSVAIIPEALDGLDDYAVIMSGEGPPSRPAFRLFTHRARAEATPDMSDPEAQCQASTLIHAEFKDAYGFDVHCQLRREVVSTSSIDSEIAPSIPFFGKRCDPKNRTGMFQHPCTGAVIEVPDAGCSRFWVAFEFGKWLFPRIENSLNILDPSIVTCAEEKFNTKFVQGCYFL